MVSRNYRGLSLGQRLYQRRDRIVIAATEIFAKQGYWHTTVDEICGLAHVAKRDFYDIYGGKEDVFRDLYDEIIEIALDATKQAIHDAPNDLENTFRAGISAFLRIALSDPNRVRILFVEAAGISEAMGLRRREALHEFSRLVQVQFDKFGSSAAVITKHSPYTQRALALVGAAKEVIADWAADRKKTSIDELTENLTEIFTAVFNSIVDFSKLSVS